MAEITTQTSTTVDVRILKVECNVRYWEDATVNGVDDDDGDLIPMRRGDTWAPFIEIDTGKVIHWPAGTTAHVHYKVCDEGCYTLLDVNGDPVRSIDGYVPAMLSPGGSGYGDYVIMDIGPDGVIANWKADLSYFDVEESK